MRGWWTPDSDVFDRQSPDGDRHTPSPGDCETRPLALEEWKFQKRMCSAGGVLIMRANP